MIGTSSIIAKTDKELAIRCCLESAYHAGSRSNMGLPDPAEKVVRGGDPTRMLDLDTDESIAEFVVRRVGGRQFLGRFLRPTLA